MKVHFLVKYKFFNPINSRNMEHTKIIVK